MISPEQAHFLWRTSWISFGSSLYALSRGHYDLALVPGGVFLTSINYWGAHHDDWRRQLDMWYVTLALFYQGFVVSAAEYGTVYYLITIMGVLSYPAGWYYYRQGDVWMSVYVHSLIHCFGNLANIILYSGCIRNCEAT
jgi:hypothetical protein